MLVQTSNFMTEFVPKCMLICVHMSYMQAHWSKDPSCYLLGVSRKYMENHLKLTAMSGGSIE
jgi:hypothetical protein